MTIYKRRSTKKHIFAGDEEGAGLVKWLNDETGGEHRADIAEALAIFHEAQQAVRGKISAFEALLKRRQDLVDKVQIAQGLISKYTFRATLIPGIDSISFKWVAAWRDSDRFIADVRFGRYGPDIAILAIMRLAEKGLLSSVKQCRCGRWFLAKFAHHRHHDDKCRLKDHRAKPGWKERRRVWRKNNKLAHKALDTGTKIGNSAGRSTK